MKILIPLLLMLLSFCACASSVEYGIDTLSNSDVAQKLAGKKLAVLTHAAAKNKSGEHLIDHLHKNFQLLKIFAPEHGLRTLADDWVQDGTDESTGLPVISLYKSGSKAPKPSDLAGIDAIVIDLQDVGVRYYTYFSTIANVMKVCAPLKIEVILLDRPNLLGGQIIEGKVLEPELAGSFTAYHTVPTRHGMTLGELALMVNTEKNIAAKLTVIPALNWKRENLLAESEREWIAPSPALVKKDQVGLYALWGTLENFNLAVGRGKNNDEAFRVIGAPWITPEESQLLADKLNALSFQHVKFFAHSWKASRALYEGKMVYGVKLIWDGQEVRTDEFTYRVASTLVKLFKDRLSLNQMSPQSYGSQSMIEAIKTAKPWESYKAIIDRDLEKFQLRRAPFLLY